MKKYFSLGLVVILIVSTLVGCSLPGIAVDKNKNVVNAEFSEYLIAEKVGTLNRDNFMTAEGGVYYKDDNGLYGIISFNGRIDTGAIYTDVNPIGAYFQVYSRAVTDSGDFAGLNSSKLVDGKGKTIIAGYAAYSILNERYIMVAGVSERAYKEDETVASYTDNGLCFNGYFSGNGTSYYKGNWFVYDIVTGGFVPGATGTGNTLVSACGRYVQFKDANGEYVKIDEKGQALPEDARLFDDGSYSIESKIGEVYDGNGQLIFNYDLTGFVPTSISNGYYMASKYTDGASKYVVMDNKGKIISSEFDDYITIYGDVVQCGDKIYNLEGKCIIKGTYESVYTDKMFGQNWMLRDDKYYTMIDKNGAVFFNGPMNNDHSVDTSYFLASKKKDGDYYYYSYKDQDYTIKGYSFAPWIVKTDNSNSMYDLVDTMTGETLLEGYNNYTSISRNSLAYYVYATYNGGADIYLVVSGAQLAEITSKKVDLYNELAAEFEKEGIKANINRETGEIALDATVLFGGDSAVLTDDGKAFLNKFIRAYTTVIFSEKYDGFISKTMVEGHTAPIKGSTYASGLPLSEERALNVKNYCLSAESGVDVTKLSNSLENIGYSNSKPIYASNGEYDLPACRRVSFRFIVNVDF